MVKDPAGATTVGTRWREDVRLAPGCWMHVESVVTEAEEPARLGMDFRSHWFTGHLTYEIVGTAGSSILRQREALRPRALPRMAVPFVERRLGPRLERRPRDIKGLLERSSAQ
jgi:hypothetical protein